MARQLIYVLLPALALVVWASRSHPTTVAFGGMLALVVTLLLAAAGGIAASLRPQQAPPSSVLIVSLLVAGGAATGWYWFRAWHYPGPETWDLAGVPILIYTCVAFLWPGVFVAEVSWLLNSLLGPLPVASFRATLLVGAAAGVAGAVGGKLISAAHYSKVERAPIQDRIAQISHSWKTAHSLHDGHLQVQMDTVLDGRPPYTALQAVQLALESGRDLLRRKDVHRLTLVIRVPSGDLARYQAGKGERGAPVWNRTQLHRERLSHGGRLNADSLQKMVEAPLWYPEREHLFSYEVDADLVRAAFKPEVPLSAGTVELHAAAWASASKITNEVARFFPEIGRVQIALPTLATEIPTKQVTPGSFRLQQRLLPEHRVLALHVTQGGAHESFDPARFFPGDSAGLFQIAVLREHFQTPYHLSGWLHEEIRLLPGVLYVSEVATDGTARLFMGEPKVEGPIELRPGQSATIGGDEIVNLGWFDRAAFRQRPGTPP